MGFLFVVLAVGVMIGGLMVRRVWQRQRREQLRDRARLKVIETQMAGLRAALRIGMAEHTARRRMHQLHDRDPFANSTLHEEPEQWRR
jgi:hypothetical protein